MKGSLLVGALMAASVASAVSVDYVGISQLWPVSTDVRVEYRLSGTSDRPVDVTVRVFDGDTELSLDGLDSLFLKGEVYGVVGDGTHVLYLDPTKLKAQIPSYSSAFKVKVSAQEAPANAHEVIYKAVNLANGEVTDITRADIKNGKYGSWTDDVAKSFGLPNSLEDLLVWTGVTNDVKWAKDYMVFRKIPAGGKSFRVGAKEGSADAQITSREKPYDVSLSADYWIGVFEVTQYQYQRLMTVNPSVFTSAADAELHPVDNVSFGNARGGSLGLGWSAQNDFETIRQVDGGTLVDKVRNLNLEKLSRLDLPSDVQWEIAARAGVAETMYDGYFHTAATESVAASHARNLGRFSGNGGIVDNGDGTKTTNGTVRVGSYAPNQYGLYDVLGNVAEWTGDVYMECPANQTVFPSGVDFLDPVGGLNNDDDYDGDASNKSRSGYRGSCWIFPARNFSLSIRSKMGRTAVASYLGFRLCITEEE